MDIHGWIALGTLAAAVVLFISKWLPLEVTSLAIPVVLALTGTLGVDEAFSGFGSRAVVALGAIFVLGEALRESGVATLLARLLERVGGRSETRLVLSVMVAAALLSAFMSNTATVAVFLPAVAVLARRTGVPSSKLMMPLAFAAILGGTLTLIGTSPNLILGNEHRLRTGATIGMFRFSVVGLPIVVSGILYLLLIGRRLLPSRTSEDRLREANLPEELARSYGFARNLYRLKVGPGSRAAGRTIAGLAIGRDFGLNVVQVRRTGGYGKKYLDPGPDQVLAPGDELFVEGAEDGARRLAQDTGTAFSSAGPKTVESVLGRGVTLAEVALSPKSAAVEQTIRDLRFRNRFGVSVLNVWRRGEPVRGSPADHAVELGDTFLVSGPVAGMRRLAADRDFLVLSDLSAAEDVRRAPLALAILALSLLPPVFGWAPLAVCTLAGAIVAGLTRCISAEGIRDAIDVRILLLVIGAIPLGSALDRHGVAGIAANALESASLGTPALLGVLFLLSATLSTLSNNAAAAVILALAAARAAAATGTDLTAAFLAVAYGTSCTFLIPFSHQCNLMVMSPGGYRTRDFVRVGVGVTLTMAAVTIALLAL